MCFDICTINIPVSIRVRGLHLVLDSVLRRRGQEGRKEGRQEGRKAGRQEGRKEGTGGKE